VAKYQAELAVEAEAAGDAAGAETWRNRSRESHRDAKDMAAEFIRNPLL
jgi:hypothetical protein